MIQHLSHEQIDKKKWDETIARSFNGMVYAYSWYLDVVAPDWEALVDDNYQTVMPLTCRTKYGINYLFPPFFVQQLGVFSSQKLDSDRVKEFINAIPEKYKLIEITLNSFNRLEEGDYIIKENTNYELDLIQPYEQLYANYNDNLKRNVKKAKKNQLSVNRKVAPDEVIKLFKDNRGKQVGNFKSADYKRLKNLMQVATQNGKGQLWGVNTKDGQLCAGAFFVESNDRAIFLFSGLSELGKQQGAMPYLIDQFINSNSEKRLTLDFEGSNDTGLAKFYKSFGSRECVYLFVGINRLPFYLRWLKK